MNLLKKLQFVLISVLFAALVFQGSFLKVVFAQESSETPAEAATSEQADSTPVENSENIQTNPNPTLDSTTSNTSQVTSESTPSETQNETPITQDNQAESTLNEQAADSTSVQTQSDTELICAQVVTYACETTNPTNCQEYPNSCIPAGWTVSTNPPSSEDSSDEEDSPADNDSPNDSNESGNQTSLLSSEVAISQISVGISYDGPSGSNLKVKFNSISGSAGSLNIKQQSLSSTQATQLGALSNNVYEITSSMNNGSFTYDLTLPMPAGVSGNNFKVLYAPDVNGLANPTQVSQSITVNGDGTFTIHDLDHFTVFVVVDPNTQANCDAVSVGTTAGTTCVATIQQAINNATDNNSPLDTITVAAGTYNETVYVNKRLVITGQGSPTVTGGFILQTTPVTITGFSASTSVVIANPTISALVGAYSGNQASYPVSGTGAANATLNYTITGTTGSTTGSTTLSSSGTFSFNANLTSLGEGSFTVDVQLTSGSYTSSNVQATQAKDSVSPTAPASITVPTQIDSTNLTTFSISGSGAEAGSKVSYTITSSGTTISATDVTTVLANGTFSISNINVSSLPDSSNVIVSVTLKDNAGPSGTGNISSATTNPTNSLKKDTAAPTTSDDTDSIWHNSSVTVTLTCADPVSGCFKTYYTTDGSTPTTSSTQGTSITLTTDGQYTIKYFSVDNYGNTETVKTATNLVKIDKTNPNTNPGTPTTTPNPTNSTSQTWNWTAATDTLSGVFQYFWRTMLGGVAGPNGIVAAPTTSVNTTLTQGAWNFFVYAKDNASNQSAEIQGSVLVDTTAPVTTDNTDSLWHNSAVTVTLSCSDAATGNSGCATTYYTTDGSTPTTSSSTGNTITLSAQGQYTIKYFSVDAATTGNQESVKTAANTVNIDTTNPTVSANNASSSWNLANISITLTVSDSGGSVLNIAKYSWDTPATSTVGTNFASGDFITIPSEGSHTLYLYAADNALNSSTFSGSYKLDTVNPTASVSGSSASWQTSLPSMIVTATDSESGVASVTYSWNGGASGATSSGADLSSSLPADGMNTLVLTVTDNAGRVTTFSGTYNIDRVSPTAAVTGSSASWQSSVPSVIISASDTTPGSGLSTVQYSWNSGAFVSSSNGADITASLTSLGNGTHSLSMVATDVAGRATVIAGTYKIDTTIPVISGVTLTNSTGNNSFVKNGDTVTLTATVTDNNQSLLTGSMITANLSALGGGASVNPTSYDSTTGLATWASLVVSGTTNGVVTVTVNAVDIANNAAIAQSVSPTADNTVPTTPGTPSTTNPTGLTTQVWNWTASTDTGAGINSYQVSVNGGAYTNIGNVLTYTTNLTQGSHTLTVQAIDNAGNISAVSLTGNVLVDTNAPVTSDNTDSLWHNSAVTITLSCSDIATGNSGCATTYYTTDGSTPTISSTQGTSVILNTNGQFTIKYFTVDAAGNSETIKTAVNLVKIDLSIPVISAVTLTNSTGNNSFVKNGDTVTLTATVTDNNQSLLTASMITANLSALGGGASVNPTTYDSLTGLATWASLVVSGTTNGVVTIAVNGVDVAANPATAATVTTTADNIQPTLSLINLVSSNTNVNLAKVGDTITLTFTSSETIQTPVVSIAGQNALVSSVGNNWTATYVLTSTDSEGLINYQVTFADLASNIGTAVNATSTITFDKTNPTTSWTTPSALENVSGNVTLTAAASDTTGIASLTFLYQRNDGVDTFHPITTVTTAPFTSVWDTNSLILDNYTLRMVVLDNAGNSTTLDQIVGVATVISSSSVSSTSTTSNSVTISWSSDDQTSSRVIYDTTSHPVLGAAPNYGYAQSTVVSDTSPKVTNHSVGLGGLSASTTYYYRVVSAGSPEAVSSEFSFTTSAQASTSSSSVGSSTGPTGAPVCVDSKPAKAPILLSARVSGKNEITLVWSKAGDPVTYYLLEYGTEHDKYQYGVADLGNVTSFTIKDLTPGLTYYFRIRGGNNCAPGEFSNELFAKADGSFVAQAVVDTISSALGATSVWAKTQTTGSEVTSLGSDLENQEFAINSEETTTSSISALPVPSPSSQVSLAKKSNIRLLLIGTALIFILAGAASYAVAIRKGNKI